MISGMRASISARLIPAVSTRSGRSIRRPSASRPSTRVITMVASLAGENAYCDCGPKGHASSLIRNEPFSSSPMPSTLAAIRQANDAGLMARTRSPTGRLEHNPDRSDGRLASPISCKLGRNQVPRSMPRGKRSDGQPRCRIAISNAYLSVMPATYVTAARNAASDCGCTSSSSGIDAGCSA